ncbi:MAG: hypothetical protein MJA83_05890, partial [Gammaproteobacteria bacterium]|nr:hypothetical protein [Gammaproteobacteria bacterium]
NDPFDRPSGALGAAVPAYRKRSARQRAVKQSRRSVARSGPLRAIKMGHYQCSLVKHADW